MANLAPSGPYNRNSDHPTDRTGLKYGAAYQSTEKLLEKIKMPNNAQKYDKFQEKDALDNFLSQGNL